MQLPTVDGHYYLRDDELIASAVSVPLQAEADRWTLTEGDIPMPTAVAVLFKLRAPV